MQTSRLRTFLIVLPFVGILSGGLALGWTRGATAMVAVAWLLPTLWFLRRTQTREARGRLVGHLLEPDAAKAVGALDRQFLAALPNYQRHPRLWSMNTAIYLRTRAQLLATRGRPGEAREAIAAMPVLKEWAGANVEGWIALIEGREDDVRSCIDALEGAETPGLLRAGPLTAAEATNLRAGLGDRDALAQVEQWIELESNSVRAGSFWVLGRGYERAGDVGKGAVFSRLAAEEMPWFAAEPTPGAAPIPPLPDLTPPEGWDRPLVSLRPLLWLVGIIAASAAFLFVFTRTH